MENKANQKICTKELKQKQIKSSDCGENSISSYPAWKGTEYFQTVTISDEHSTPYFPELRLNTFSSSVPAVCELNVLTS